MNTSMSTSPNSSRRNKGAKMRAITWKPVLKIDGTKTKQWLTWFRDQVDLIFIKD